MSSQFIMMYHVPMLSIRLAASSAACKTVLFENRHLDSLFVFMHIFHTHIYCCAGGLLLTPFDLLPAIKCIFRRDIFNCYKELIKSRLAFFKISLCAVSFTFWYAINVHISFRRLITSSTRTLLLQSYRFLVLATLCPCRHTGQTSPRDSIIFSREEFRRN